MAEERLLPRDALEKNAPRPLPPLAGFWFRLGALAIDVFLLRIVLQVAYPIFRPPALQIGWLSVFLGAALGWFYLFLAEGPVGKGMTVGKAILGIRTTDGMGGPLSPPAAALRALLLMALAVPFLCTEMASRLVLSGNSAGVFLVAGVLNGLARAYIVANAFLCVLHPLKQSVHDLAAGSLILREAGAHNLPAFMEQIAEPFALLRRRAMQVSAIAFLALAGLHFFSTHRQINSPETARQIEFLRTFTEEFRTGTFEPFYQPTRLDAALKWMASGSQSPRDTSPSLLLSSPRGGAEPATNTHVIAFVFRSHNDTRKDDSLTTERIVSITDRAVRWAERQVTEGLYPFDRESRIRRTMIFQPEYLVTVFIEEVNLLLYGRNNILTSRLVPLGIPKGFYQIERDEWLRESAEATSMTEPTDATTQTAKMGLE